MTIESSAVSVAICPAWSGFVLAKLALEISLAEFIMLIALAAFVFAASEFLDFKLLLEEREESDEIELRDFFPEVDPRLRAAIFLLVLEDLRVGRFLELIERRRVDVRTFLRDVE